METTAFRLPRSLLQALAAEARQLGVPRSAILRQALRAYFAAEKRKPATALALVDSIVTWKGSGRGNLARDSEKILRERLRARRSR